MTKSESTESFVKHIDYNNLTKKDAEMYKKTLEGIVKDIKSEERSLNNSKRALNRASLYFLAILIISLVSAFLPGLWYLKSVLTLILALVYITITYIDIKSRTEPDLEKKKKLK